VINKTEENLVKLLNLMLDKKDTETTSTTSTAISTEEVYVNVIKVNGSELPVEYSTDNGGFSLPKM